MLYTIKNPTIYLQLFHQYCQNISNLNLIFNLKLKYFLLGIQSGKLSLFSQSFNLLGYTYFAIFNSFSKSIIKLTRSGYETEAVTGSLKTSFSASTLCFAVVVKIEAVVEIVVVVLLLLLTEADLLASTGLNSQARRTIWFNTSETSRSPKVLVDE